MSAAGAGGPSNFTFANNSSYDALKPGEPLSFTFTEERQLSDFTVEQMRTKYAAGNEKKASLKKVLEELTEELRDEYPEVVGKIKLKGDGYFYGPIDIPQTLTTFQLPTGATLHRYDEGGAKEPASEMPAFFGNRTRTRVYARAGKNTAKANAALSSYTVTTPARLFDLNLNNLAALFNHPDLSEAEQKILRAYIKYPEDDIPEFERSIFPIYARYAKYPVTHVRPALPIGPKNEKGYQPYLNRKMADLICKLGFDGWVARPLNPGKKQGYHNCP